MTPAATRLPLAGVKVLDLTHVLAGPFCTLTLAQLGADIIKIEQPGGGDSARVHGPWREDEYGRRASAEIINLGRNKRSVAIDLKQDRGRELLLELVEESDVLVENFRPEVMGRLRLDYPVISERNPGIIYAAISGFGHDETLPSPYRDRPAFNPIAQGMSGLAYLNGDRDRAPVLSSAAIGDFIPGLYAALGICAALREHERTGSGTFLDVAMYDSLIPLNARAILLYSLTGEVQERGAGSRYSTIMGKFKVSDGYVVITVRGDPMWKSFCEAVGHLELLDDPILNKNGMRGEYYESMILPLLEEWGATQTKSSACELLLAAGVSAGPINNTRDLFEDEHVRARHMLREVGDMTGGTATVPGMPIKFKGVEDGPEREADWVGDSGREVLSEVLRYDATTLDELESLGVIFGARRAVQPER